MTYNTLQPFLTIQFDVMNIKLAYNDLVGNEGKVIVRHIVDEPVIRPRGSVNFNLLFRRGSLVCMLI